MGFSFLFVIVIVMSGGGGMLEAVAAMPASNRGPFIIGGGDLAEGPGRNLTSGFVEREYQPCIHKFSCRGSVYAYQPDSRSSTSCDLPLLNPDPKDNERSPDLDRSRKDHDGHVVPVIDERMFVALPRHYMERARKENGKSLCGATVTMQIRSPSWPVAFTTVKGKVKDECVECLAGNVRVSQVMFDQLSRKLGHHVGAITGIAIWWVGDDNAVRWEV